MLCRLRFPAWLSIISLASSLQAADAPSAKLALSFRPVHRSIQYDIPSEAEIAKCKVKVERTESTSGWVVLNGDEQVLRRFVDTNQDNVVDQWRYYHQGLEVYRDIDSNFNNKVDQSRWLNTGGSRWGLDRDEDGRVDTWKQLSAEEASREAVEALVAQDAARMAAVLITSSDLEQLGVAQNLREQLLASVAKPAEQMKSIVQSTKLVNANTKWTRFDNSTLTPSSIPADDGKAKQDLMIYQSAMALVDNAGQTGLLQLGEMIRVDDVWKLTQIPKPIEGTTLTTTGILMQPATALASTGAPAASISKEMQKLLDALRELDQNSPTPTAPRATIGEYNRRRADLLTQIVAAADGDQEKSQWMRQLIDGIAAAVQTGAYPDGLARLQALDTRLQREDSQGDLAGYARYRLILAEYTKRITDASSDDRAEVQTWWLDQLESFVKTYPKSSDAADALLQLAITQEFSGKLADAEKWYRRLQTDHGETAAGIRAAGALRRFELEGKQLVLSGPTLDNRTLDIKNLRGRVVVVVFWSTWCQPCTEDLPQLKAVYEKYRAQGFEIVGVNLDNTTAPIAGYLSEHRVPWNHIYEAGGLESRLAKQFGIISLPTMFLVNKTGQVVSRNSSVDDLKEALPALLK